MKALVGAFNQEEALVGAFSVIVQPVVEPMDRFTALLQDSSSEAPDENIAALNLFICLVAKYFGQGDLEDSED